MREFNTSGQNIIDEHYTLMRPELVKKGVELVKKAQYFTIQSPCETGKSTYLVLLTDVLRKQGYKVARVNFENYTDKPIDSFLEKLATSLESYWDITFTSKSINHIFNTIKAATNQMFVLQNRLIFQ